MSVVDIHRTPCIVLPMCPSVNTPSPPAPLADTVDFDHRVSFLAAASLDAHRRDDSQRDSSDDTQDNDEHSAGATGTPLLRLLSDPQAQALADFVLHELTLLIIRHVELRRVTALVLEEAEGEQPFAVRIARRVANVAVKAEQLLVLPELEALRRETLAIHPAVVIYSPVRKNQSQ